MKKGRPGILLSVLISKSKLDGILKVIFSQTTTLGVRIQPSARKKVQRDTKTVQTTFGKLRVKVINCDGCERMVPEHDECRRLALEHKMSLVEVYRVIERKLQCSIMP
jgi:pyridinium-3,5-bisthiocarboxylic acid mononucleotide nickel chelatase